MSGHRRAGYIGGQMALALGDAGEKAVVLDDLSTGFHSAVHFASDREIGIIRWKVQGASNAQGAVMTNDAQENLTFDDLITSDPEVLGGRQVFRGTRVPIEVLFENLADGMSIDEVLDQYDTLDREDVVRVLELTSSVLSHPRAA